MNTSMDKRSKDFDIFISYNRSDVEFTELLEKSLENYKPPSGLNLPARNLRVFRDEQDMVGVDYFKSIERFLEKSKTLIVICSPAARQSDYVNDEIERFSRLKGYEKIIPVLVAGLPNNETGEDNTIEAAFPERLISLLRTPLAIDYRGFKSKQDHIRKGSFAPAWYMLLSNIYERSRAEIEERDRKRQRRRLATTVGIGTVVAATISAFGVIAWLQYIESSAERLAGQAVSQVVRAADMHLPSYNVDINAISISGVSSGGFMADLLYRKYPQAIMGVAIISGGPFNCASTFWLPRGLAARTVCSTDISPVVFFGPPRTDLKIFTQQFSSPNVKGDMVFFYYSEIDPIVPMSVTSQLYNLYGSSIPLENIQYVNTIRSGHGMITDRYGESCGSSSVNGINNCGFDLAGEILVGLYGSLRPPVESKKESIVMFDQSQFCDKYEKNMCTFGAVYVPENCRNGSNCKLHIALQGCFRAEEQLQNDAFINYSGFNEWAEANNIIVLYPQVINSSYAITGCWDWWKNDDVQKSVHSTIISKMINIISGKKALHYAP